MELIYLWIENYKSFHSEGFSFSPSHLFSYDAGSNQLTYRYTDNSYDNFFNLSKLKYGKISNVTAIVGGNGSGKTTLFRAVLNLLQNGDNDKNYILVLADQGDFQCCTNKAILKIHGLAADKYQISSLTGSMIMQHLKSTQIIYSSNVFDSSCLYGSFGSGQISDISNNGLLNSDLKESIPAEVNPLSAYYNADFIRQLEFICKYPDDELTPLIQLPTILQVSFAKHEPLKKLIRQSLNSPASLKGKEIQLYQDETGISNLFQLLDNICRKEQSIKNQLAYGFILSMLCQVLTHYKGGNSSAKIENINRYLFEFVTPIIEDQNIYKQHTDILMFVSDLSKLLNSRKGIPDLSPLMDCFHQLLNWINTHDDILSVKLSDSSSSFTIQVDSSYLNPIREFYSLYRQSASIYHYLAFSWPLSTGEYHILSLFSRFYSLTERERPKSKRRLKLTGPISGIYADHAIILLDEADISLHPKWQQKYLKLLISFLCNIFYHCSIQIIFSTHSPIMLSDIPLADTIYLSDHGTASKVMMSGRKETFGASIYQIYNNYYFLDQNYSSAMIGDFAKERIGLITKALEDCESQLIKHDGQAKHHNELNLEKLQKQLNHCSKTISILGEELIKDVLSRKCRALQLKLNEIHSSESPSSDFLEDFKVNYRELSEAQRQSLIRYIISEEEQ